MDDTQPDLAQTLSPNAADYNSLAHFRRHKLAPWAAVYVELDDFLVFNVWAPSVNTSVVLTLRYQTPAGDIVPDVIELKGTTGTIAPNTKVIPGCEGYLLSASITAAAGRRGDIFVQLQMLRGQATGDQGKGNVLIQGYVSAIDALAYPAGPIVNAEEGRGSLIRVDVGNPAAGADWTQTVPINQQWIIRAVIFVLTASVAAGTRSVNLLISDQVPTVLMRIPSITTQGPSTVNTYTYGPGLWGVVTNAAMSIPIPPELRLMPGWQIGSSEQNKDAADQFSAIHLLTEQYVMV